MDAFTRILDNAVAALADALQRRHPNPVVTVRDPNARTGTYYQGPARDAYRQLAVGAYPIHDGRTLLVGPTDATIV